MDAASLFVHLGGECLELILFFLAPSSHFWFFFSMENWGEEFLFAHEFNYYLP